MRVQLHTVLCLGSLLFTGFGCFGSSAPPCVQLSQLSETTDDYAIVNTVAGETVEDAILLESSQVSEAPAGPFMVLITEQCDTQDCQIQLDCGPDEINAGDRISCTVTDEADPTAACQRECTLTVEVLYGDDAACTDLLQTHYLRVLHSPDP